MLFLLCLLAEPIVSKACGKGTAMRRRSTVSKPAAQTCTSGVDGLSYALISCVKQEWGMLPFFCLFILLTFRAGTSSCIVWGVWWLHDKAKPTYLLTVTKKIFGLTSYIERLLKEKMCRKLLSFFFSLHVGFLLAELPQLAMGTAWLSTSDSYGRSAGSRLLCSFCNNWSFICIAKSSSCFKGVWVWW